MAVKYVVPSLFSNGTWTCSLVGGDGWEPLFRAWDAEGFLNGVPKLPRPIVADEDVSLHTREGNFRVRLARTHSHLEHGTLPNRRSLPQFDAWSGIPVHKRSLEVGVFSGPQSGRKWLQLRPGGIGLDTSMHMPVFHPSALAPVLASAAQWNMQTLAFLHELEDRAAPRLPWYLLMRTQMEPLDNAGRQPARPALAFDALNHALRQARGTQAAGTPFQGLLPSFRSAHDDFDPLSLVRLDERRSGTSRAWGSQLLRIDLGESAAGKEMIADVDWFLPTRDDYGSKVATGFSVRGTIQAKAGDPQFGRRWGSSGASLTALLEAMLSAAGATSDIASFRLERCRLEGTADWIRLGSIEVRPTGFTQDAALDFRVSGQVGSGATAVFPSCKLSGLRCEVRNAAGDDPVTRWAAIDAGNEVPGETAPIIARIGAGTPHTGTLTITTNYAPGRHGTTEIRIDMGIQGAGTGSSAVWLNLRPFMAALVDFPDPANAAATLLWRSDDPQGAQWRVEDPTVTLALPPQAVGEEMERGDRFYDPPATPGGALVPHLQAGAVVPYRFSRPAYLTLRPSPREQNRRFEKSPINFRSLMRGSHVERMLFEMAYPLEVLYQWTPRSARRIVLTEAGEFFGEPAERIAADAAPRDRGKALPEELRAYLRGLPAAAQQAYVDAVEGTMQRQDAVRVNFASRLAELHIHDPLRPREDVALAEDLSISLRHQDQGAAPLISPLPRSSAFDPAGVQPGGAFARFLKNGTDWGSDGDGGIRGGLIHSFEMPSELVEVLDMPQAVAGVIEALALSALGATGRMEASFAKGKTSFAVVAEHGQLSRLVKTRIGRIGALWNRAKHVVVYERSTARSAQFEDEQSATGAFDRWPILRKAEEYIEPVEEYRDFHAEAQKQSNATGFIKASAFASKRIYVNSAWGRDLADGYELPLWDRAASETNPKFYPRPKIFLDCFGEEGRTTRLWFRDPDRLFFYTSTAPDTDADTDAWAPRLAVDFDNVPRVGVLEPKQASYGKLEQRTPADPALCLSPRFDLAVEAEGPVNLQHGRGTTPMLVRLDRVGISRSSQRAPEDIAGIPELGAAQAAIAQTGRARLSARKLETGLADLRGEMERLVGRAMAVEGSCAKVAAQLGKEVDAAVDRFQTELDPVAEMKLGELVQRGRAAWQATFTELSREFASRALLPEALLAARTQALLASVEDLQKLIAAHPPELAKKLAQRMPALAGELRTLADDLRSRLDVQLARVVGELDATLRGVATTAAEQARELKTGAGTLSERARRALQELAKVSDRLEKLPAATRKVVEVPANWLRVLCRQLESVAAAADLVGHAAPGLAAALAGALAGLSASIGTLAARLSAEFAAIVDKAAASALARLETLVLKPLQDKADDVQAALDPAAAGKHLGELAQLLREGDDRLRARYRMLVQEVQVGLATANEQIVKALLENANPIVAMADAMRELSLQVSGLAEGVRKRLKDAIGVGTDACEEILRRVRSELDLAERWAREQARNALAEVLSSEAARQVEHYAQTAGKAWDIGSKGLALARAVGDLPRITPLEFDIDVAAYVFEGTKPGIRMSPAVARVMQQGQEVLESLGVTVPCDQLLDRLEPEIRAGLYRFNDIFNRFAGMDFRGLFERFRLPALNSDNVRITHGFEKLTRRAWVESTVNFARPQFEELFGFGPVALGLERMVFDAFTGIETRLEGNKPQQPVSRTHASLLADWVLLGSGQRLVTFRQVAIRYDGAAGFDFGVSPDNIELHPALKFVSEFIERFKRKLPPAIQIEEEDGRPVGVSAGSTVVIDDLPDLGAVSIGPIDMRSRLALRLVKHRGLAIESAFSLGNKQSPIFVQISWLGGGCWLEARASYLEGRVTPAISVGLSLGSTRAFNLANVARGSFNVQLFCYIEIQAGSESIAVGLSVVGSALIVGFVNANVSLLLEARHSRGSTQGTGRLDVSVKISWFYTFRFKRTVTHKF